MGGRGASSGGGVKTLHPTGTSAYGGQWSKGIGFQNYDTLKDAIGTKGKPKSMIDATLNSNPHFDRTGTYKEFTENCQRSVVAYEARRRGYDVTAQPTYKGDTLPQVIYNSKTGTANGRWQGAFKNAKTDNVGGKNASQTRRKVETQMATYGNNSRAVLGFTWKDGRSGHVINVEYRNGKTYYNDAQVGGKYNAGELFNSIKPNSARLVRVDNLKFSDRAKKSISKDKW